MTAYKFVGLSLLEEELDVKPEKPLDPSIPVVLAEKKTDRKLATALDAIGIGRDTVITHSSLTVLIDISDTDKLAETIHLVNKRNRIVIVSDKPGIRNIARPKGLVYDSFILTDDARRYPKLGSNCRLLNVNTLMVRTTFKRPVTGQFANISLDHGRKTINLNLRNIDYRQTRNAVLTSIHQLAQMTQTYSLPEMRTDLSHYTGDYSSLKVTGDPAIYDAELTSELLPTTIHVQISAVDPLCIIFARLYAVHYTLRPVITVSDINQIVHMRRSLAAFHITPETLPNDEYTRIINATDEKYNLTLKYHQMYAIHNMMRHNSPIMNCATGIGKSRMAIGACLALDIKSVLYVTEPSIVLEVDREMKKINFTDYQIVKNPDNRNLRRFNIISYSMLSRKTIKGILKTKRFGAIIWDECQELRNMDSLRTRNAMKLRAKRHYFMSATSVANDISDILSYIMVAKKTVTTYYDFSRKLSGGATWRKGFKRAKNKNDVKGFISLITEKYPMFEEIRRRLINNNHQLLEKFRNENMVIINKSDKQLVKDNTFRVTAKTLKMTTTPDKEHMELYLEKLDAINRAYHPEQTSHVSLQMITELLKISEIPNAVDGKSRVTSKQRKILAAVKDVSERKNSVIVFTGFTESAKQLHSLISTDHKSTILITSDSNVDQRYRKIEEFRKTKNACLIGNIDLIGKGFNLEVADTIIMSDIPWSPFKYEQSIGRILRPDQKGQPEIINCINRMMIDEYKFEVLLSKQNRIDKMINKDSSVSDKDMQHMNFTDFLTGVIERAKEEGLI